MWDSAGQEKYRVIKQNQNYYNGVCGIILVFDVTDQSSFDDLSKHWIPIINETLQEPVELLVLGNKIDLINERYISEEDAYNWLENHPDL